MTHLHKEFTRIYRTKFTDYFPTKQDVVAWMELWGAALADLTGEQLRAGLERCAMEREWPPTAPAEFIKLCRPSPNELGIPEAAQALELVCNTTTGRQIQERWGHPVVFHAARDARLNLYQLRLMTWGPAMHQWEPIYTEYVARYARGEVFEFPVEKAIEDRTRKAVTPEEKKKHRIRGLMALRNMRRGLQRNAYYEDRRWQQVHGMKPFV